MTPANPRNLTAWRPVPSPYPHQPGTLVPVYRVPWSAETPPLLLAPQSETRVMKPRRTVRQHSAARSKVLSKDCKGWQRIVVQRFIQRSEERVVFSGCRQAPTVLLTGCHFVERSQTFFGALHVSIGIRLLGIRCDRLQGRFRTPSDGWLDDFPASQPTCGGSAYQYVERSSRPSGRKGGQNPCESTEFL